MNDDSLIEAGFSSGYPPPMESEARRTAPPEVRKRQILDAARSCFIRDGFASTKVSDVAQAAGVSVGLVYRYFSDKAALMTAIVAEEAHDQFNELVEPAQHLGTVARLTTDELVGALQRGLQNRNRVLLMLEVTTAIMRDEDLRRTAVTIQLEQANALAERLAPVMDCGFGVEELGARLQVLAGLAAGLAIQIAVAPDTEPDVTRLFHQSANAILSDRL